MLAFFADTDCDINLEDAKKYGLHLISMPYSIDGKTVYPYEDFEEFEGKAFYDQLRSGVLPNTSAISEERYINYFEPVFANGDDILYIHFSSAMTMTFQAMDKAVAALKEKYPERKFYSVDTLGITVISRNIILEAADMYKAGKSAEEIVAWAEGERQKFAIYFFADDLKFFKHSGRVSGIAATMGTLLGVRPIIYMNEEGKMVSIGKERGRARAVERLINYVTELGENVAGHRIIIGHTDSPDIAAEIEAKLREKFGADAAIECVLVNPTAGSHCGPNGVGISFHAVHR